MPPPKTGPTPSGASASTRPTRQRPVQSVRSESEEPSEDDQGATVAEQSTSGASSEIERLRQDLAQAYALLGQLRLSQHSVEPGQLLPTTETPPTIRPSEIRAASEAIYSDFARYAKTHKSEKTPRILELDDGTDPTFKQWQASVQDRLEVNSDHYRTERERMALVWGHTVGLAKGYLEPRYLSDNYQDRFQNAEEMIKLLKSCFVTGNEAAESRLLFDRLQMGEDDAFVLFKARFLSAAVRGQVPRSEWFHYLWTKITPGLRVPNLGFKRLWDNSFEQMVEHLTAYDMERGV